MKRARITRRGAMVAAGLGSAVLGTRPRRGRAAPVASTPPKLTFFTADEHALLDELSEIIIPTDAHSPGARAAGAAATIDAMLGELPERFPEYKDRRAQWRAGLARTDALCREMHGKPFLQTTMPQRLDVVARMAANEKKPEKEEETFWREMKREVARAYYLSEIGLKQEIEYKGNSYLQEFEGIEAAKVKGKRRPRPAR